MDVILAGCSAVVFQFRVPDVGGRSIYEQSCSSFYRKLAAASFQRKF
jgi:hypothetical protein